MSSTCVPSPPDTYYKVNYKVNRFLCYNMAKLHWRGQRCHDSRGALYDFGDLETAERNGKLDIASHIACPFCDSQRTTIKEDVRGVLLPFCHICGVFLVLVWQIAEDATGRHLAVRLSPKPEHAIHTEKREVGEASHRNDKATPHPDTKTSTIPTPQLAEQLPEEQLYTPKRRGNGASEHKDVAGQVLRFLTQHNQATTREMLDALDCSRVSLNNALRKLTATKQLRKVKHGVYILPIRHCKQ